MRPLRDPRFAGALAAAAVRGCVSWQAWHANWAISHPTLDAEYYVAWARDIAAGDVLGRHGTIGGDPFVLNPLYAYVLAPIVAVFGASTAAVIVFQVLLAGATAWLAASAARRFSGSAVAGWIAAGGVAFSAALTHLDGYVAVSGLAAFLVAGTCWSCAPPDREAGGAAPEFGHGPLAAGVWLGLSALARPIVLFALPFVLLLFVLRAPRGSGRRLRASALVLAPFLACAALSFARNVAVSGQNVVFTAANGQNLYLGNNAAARRLRQMTTDEFHFSPRDMHEDAKFLVSRELGREPTRSDISAWFTARAWGEFRDHPGESLAWYGEKVRWYFSPEEPASSADLDYDLQFAPLLRLAFVPTWLIAALAAAAALVAANRRDLLLGPGALVFAHVAACTLTFPIEHYRSPAIPAMAVLAGCAVAAAWDGLRRGAGRPLVLLLIAAGAVALAGSVSPQPQYQLHVLRTNEAIRALEHRDFETAERDCREALALEPKSLGAREVLFYVFRESGRFKDARPWAQGLVADYPWNPKFRMLVAWLDVAEGRIDGPLAVMDALVEEFPWSPLVRGWRGEMLANFGRIDRAREDLRFALDHGVVPGTAALEKCGLQVPR